MCIAFGVVVRWLCSLASSKPNNATRGHEGLSSPMQAHGPIARRNMRSVYSIYYQVACNACLTFFARLHGSSAPANRRASRDIASLRIFGGGVLFYPQPLQCLSHAASVVHLSSHIQQRPSPAAIFSLLAPSCHVHTPSGRYP